MKLLNLPTQGTRFLCVLRRILRQVVRHDPIRAVGRNLDPEELHLEVLGKPVDLDPFAVLEFVRIPTQAVHRAIRRLPFAVIHAPVGLDGAVELLAHPIHQQHQVLGGVPGVEQHAVKRQVLAGNGAHQHVLNMVQLGLAVLLRGKDPIVDGPILAGLGIDVDAIHQADTLDQAVGVATVLPPYQFDMVRVILVEDGVVKHDAAPGANDDFALGMLPDLIRGQLVALQVALDRVVAESWAVIRKLCHG